MVEFGDYECPFCRQFDVTTFKEICKNFIDTGQLLFIHRDLPLAMHSNALPAAQAALCAGDQKQFWPMHDLLLANPDRLQTKDIVGLGANLPMDLDLFRKCAESEKFKSVLAEEVRTSENLGVTSTPTFLIGLPKVPGVEGTLLVGAQPYAKFE